MTKIKGSGFKIKTGDVINGSKFRDKIVTSIQVEKVPDWISEEIKSTWEAARDSGSQMDAFKIFERLTDRLGYGRMQNNPSLAPERKRERL